MEFIRYSLFALLLAVVHARHASERQVVINPNYPQTNQHCDVICDDESPNAFREICGTDGILYKSSCDYNNALCKARQHGQTLRYASVGPECVTDTTTCDVLQHTTCVNAPSTPYSPYINYPYGYPVGGTTLTTGYQTQVCGSDGKTYGSLCQLKQTVCKLEITPGFNGTLPEVDHDGPCETQQIINATEIDCSKYVVDLQGLALEGGTHVTLRVMPCTGQHSMICALNGRTYTSECSYCGVLAAQHVIQTGHLTAHIRHAGSCHSSIVG